MTFADGPVILWIGVMVLLGVAGFIVMALVMTLKVGSFLFRSLFGGEEPQPRRPLPGARGPAADDASLVCSNDHCRHLNASRARFCARCGQRLRKGYDVDRYG